MDMGLTDKVAIVTGGSEGIGKFAAAGWAIGKMRGSKKPKKKEQPKKYMAG